MTQHKKKSDGSKGQEDKQGQTPRRTPKGRALWFGSVPVKTRKGGNMSVRLAVYPTDEGEPQIALGIGPADTDMLAKVSVILDLQSCSALVNAIGRAQHEQAKQTETEPTDD